MLYELVPLSDILAVTRASVRSKTDFLINCHDELEVSYMNVALNFLYLGRLICERGRKNSLRTQNKTTYMTFGKANCRSVGKSSRDQERMA